MVESVQGAAAPHKRSCSEWGGVEGGKAPAAAEADRRSGLSTCLIAKDVSFQRATSSTAADGWVTAPAEAVAPDVGEAGSGCAATWLSTASALSWSWCGSFLWEKSLKRGKIWLERNNRCILLFKCQTSHFLLIHSPTWTPWHIQSDHHWRTF